MIDPGTELSGKYRVIRLLGEGGMGAVYEAEHVGISRRVAVKVLHEQYGTNDQALARFEREARAAGAIGHENIVEVLDLGTHRSLPFIVMELLRGEPLCERIAADGSIDPSRAVRIAGQVLSALASAHAAGIVHRDLKPENIHLITRGAARDVVKLLDFGISKVRRADAPNRLVTEDGAFLGTPAYMAPEQWMGRRDVDHRADLFSVGVILYEMLTGTLPFEGETQGELFLEIVKGTTEPPPPSEIAPEVSGALDAVVLRAVQRDPTARFQTAQEFLEALRAHGAADVVAIDALPSAPLTNDVAAPPVRRRLAAPEPTSIDPSAAARRPRSRAPWAVVLATICVVSGGAFALRRSSHAPRVTTASVAMSAARSPSPQPRDATPPPAPTVTLEVRGVPDDAVVELDGARVPALPLHVQRGDRERVVTIRTASTSHEIRIVPDRDQVLLVDVAPPAHASVAPVSSTQIRASVPHIRARARASSVHHTGLGEMNVTNDF